MRTSKTKDIAYCALGIALISVCAWISIPAPVPFTLQTFGIFAVLGLLGGKRGTISIFSYIILGAIGLPVFSGFRGGIGVLFGTTGGYILGFLLSGVIYWILEKKDKRELPRMAVSMLLGVVAWYVLGTAWFLVLYTRSSGSIGLIKALSLCVFPFLIPDLLKIILALFVSKRVGKYLSM